MTWHNDKNQWHMSTMASACPKNLKYCVIHLKGEWGIWFGGGGVCMLTGQCGIENLVQPGCWQGKTGKVQNTFQVLSTKSVEVFVSLFCTQFPFLVKGSSEIDLVYQANTTCDISTSQYWGLCTMKYSANDFKRAWQDSLGSLWWNSLHFYVLCLVHWPTEQLHDVRFPV